MSTDEAFHRPAVSGMGIKAELRRSRPGFALKSFAAVRFANKTIGGLKSYYENNL